MESAIDKVEEGMVSTTPKEIYRQNKEMWQHRAAYLLGEMGTTARMAETNLASATNSANWYLRGAATVALMKIRSALTDSDPWVRREAQGVMKKFDVMGAAER